MGFDISSHAVDTRLMTERLIPALLGQASIDDLLNRASDLCVVASRANQWGLRVTQLNQDFFYKQMDAEVEQYLSLPGFDTDLCVWGRPFFIVADSVDESLAELSRYTACTGQDLSAVDRLAASMLTKLDSKRTSLPQSAQPSVKAMLDALYPLADHLPELKEDNRKDASFADTRRRLAAMIESYREAWTHRGTERLIESEVFEEPTSAADMARGAPYMLLNLAAQVLPGWMGRGYVWPTQLFEKIGVGVSHVFEKPTALFEPLVRAFPEIEEGFSTTIFQNYSLGGYVRPANVAVLKALLEKHRRELILAWIEPEQAADADLDELSADYRKILEPVTLAERQGHGFIEAAEIYSGFMGVMN